MVLLRGHDMPLFRLVYASTSLLSDKPHLAREQIEQILFVSRRNNEAAEITGALLFSDTNFSQVLAMSALRGKADISICSLISANDPKRTFSALCSMAFAWSEFRQA